jgi:hypothetical protein
MPARQTRRQRNETHRWSGLSDTELLQWRFRELGLTQRNSFIAPDIHDLYKALERRGIRFRPHVWLSTEWFSPDGIPGIAIPFFAAHPRLAQLERRMRGEAEGGNRSWRRRILRHEAGHALDTAFGLRRRADWRAVFGRASKPYPSRYAARPASRRFVQYLGHWYAQSHPTEDFAETFAVWLQPKARWRREYAGWPALEKLEYVDDLMAECAGRRARNSDRTIVAALADNQRTLREHYRRQADAENPTDKRYDRWLARAFICESARPEGLPASAFLAQIEPELKQQIARQIGVGPYLVGQVAWSVRKRAAALKLVLRHNRRESKKTAARLYARIVEDLLRRNRERYVL